MKNIIIGLTVFCLLPVMGLAGQLKEVCSMGSSCVYTIYGNSKRVITANFAPGYYRCFTTSGDELAELSIENVQSPSGVNVNVESSLVTNPFMIIDNHGKKSAMIRYEIRNHDYPILGNHQVSYVCMRGYR